MRTWALLPLLALAFLSTRGTAQEPRKPNVIIVLCDDMGWGDVAYHGSNKITRTPNLDALARESVRFNSFHSSSPNCSPTRGAILTGRMPTRYGIYSTKYPLPQNELTIADVLRPLGYRSGHFGKWHLGGLGKGMETSPGGQGFDTWFSIGNSYGVHRFDTGGFSRDGVGGVKTKGYVEDVIFDEALQFIRASAAKKQPFFAHICTLAPHSPHEAPERLCALFPQLTKEEQLYWGMIASIDENVGRLRAELRKLGIAEDTLLVFTSDNGGTRQSRGHDPFGGGKGGIWEGGLRVPGLISWPARVKTSFATDIPASVCDLLPTFVTATGATLPKDALPLDGINLLPLIDGQWKERPSPIVFHFGGDLEGAGAPAAKGKKSELGKAGFVVLDGNLRYVTTLAGKESGLFDLAKDPGETRNIAAQHPDAVARLKGIQESWWASVRADPHFLTLEQANKMRGKYK